MGRPPDAVYSRTKARIHTHLSAFVAVSDFVVMHNIAPILGGAHSRLVPIDSDQRRDARRHVRLCLSSPYRERTT
jgi:hypothetical protein